MVMIGDYEGAVLFIWLLACMNSSEGSQRT